MGYNGPKIPNQKAICREIIGELLQEKTLTRKIMEKTAKKICKKYNLPDIPSNVQILQLCSVEERRKLKDVLLMKPVRTISGVTIITVASKPAKCPGSCIYCTRGENAPQSYIGLEPAIQRAIRNNYDPFLQISNRLEQYSLMGHPVDKIELIIIGGTFLALDKKYQEWFVRRLFDALNSKRSKNLQEAQRINETAKHRCTGLTIETRPDFCKEKHIDEMLRYGVTRVEIGTQTIYPDILKVINRGHTLQDTIDAIRIARNAGLKITLHLMPNLPGSDLDKDLEMFKTIFEDQNFRPDYLKIYPTLVIKKSKLYEMWRRNEYKAYTTKELVELLAKVKKYIPKYARIQRLGRDVPATEIESGCKKTNIRELVQQKTEELGINCNCIRCREVGFKIKQGIFSEARHIKLCRMDYEASNGKEVFLSFEDTKNDIILAFLRLRIPEESHRAEIDSDTCLVRELKVMGTSVPIKLPPKKFQWQHRGYGKLLIKKAEEIVKEYGKKKLIVISAIGTRKYYLNLGYKRDNAYVSKILT